MTYDVGDVVLVPFPKNILKKLGALTALDQKKLFEVMSNLFDSTSDDK
ncbi:hypothetical protein [Cysteiniphilum sp. 6C5]